MCVFSNLAQPNAWTHTATYRSHTHDILCSAVAILKENYTLIFNTQMKKQIKRQITTSLSTARSVKRDAGADEPTKKQKVECGTAVDGIPAPSLPTLPLLDRSNPSVLVIVSGGADGTLVATSSQSRQENMTVKYYDYPGWFSSVCRCDEAYCLLSVGRGCGCECSTTTRWIFTAWALPRRM